METNNFNYRQLILAREYRGYSQSELSNSITGLSQPNLSKFEKGLGGLSEEILSTIATFLNFPYSFFNQNIYNTIYNAHFRKKATITKKDRVRFDTNIKFIGYIIDKMSESIDWPDYNFPYFDVEDGFSPEVIASHIRKFLNIKPHEPIENINTLLEKSGIIIVEFNPDSKKFDGVSFITDNGTPVIIINQKFSNDRKRFTIAHELGHLILHLVGNTPISEYRDKENEANNFAAEFLMPENSIYNSLTNLKLSDLATLKQYWQTSMASLTYRAKKIGAIDSNRYTYLNIELSRNGYKKKEPFEVNIDKPTLFKAGYNMHKEELSYSEMDFINGFCLPIDIIESYFNQKMLRLVV